MKAHVHTHKSLYTCIHSVQTENALIRTHTLTHIHTEQAPPHTLGCCWCFYRQTFCLHSGKETEQTGCVCVFVCACMCVCVCVCVSLQCVCLQVRSGGRDSRPYMWDQPAHTPPCTHTTLPASTQPTLAYTLHPSGGNTQTHDLPPAVPYAHGGHWTVYMCVCLRVMVCMCDC